MAEYKAIQDDKPHEQYFKEKTTALKKFLEVIFLIPKKNLSLEFK